MTNVNGPGQFRHSSPVALVASQPAGTVRRSVPDGRAPCLSQAVPAQDDHPGAALGCVVWRLPSWLAVQPAPVSRTGYRWFSTSGPVLALARGPSSRRGRRSSANRGHPGTVACVEDSDVIPRRAARVLLVDAGNRVLLLHEFNPSAPAELFWFTIGGCIDPEESTAEAAARELLEEAGLAVDPADLGDPCGTGSPSSASTEGVTVRTRTTSYCAWSLSRSASRVWTRSSRRPWSGTAGGKPPTSSPLARRSSQRSCPGCYAS
jgi:ADP-ribose pyrophosphatase YjhB (NUDIX family)